jgi:3-phosphoshikimate 1-carboxyvinyltransferase
VEGTITLSGSKSISNRVLLIRALASGTFNIENLSDSDDTATLEQLLNVTSGLLDAHHAGTTFRFMTAYLALQDGTQVLTGSERMKQRPIKALADALNFLGANIEYMEKDGFPPLKINPPSGTWKNEISLPADISSQFITALLLIGPQLPDGLKIHLTGEIVSVPYIEMTIDIMSYFGVKTSWEGQTLSVAHQSYIPKDYFVEADWSAASYYYVIAGLAASADIKLKGLKSNSIQGDSAIAEIGKKFGIETVFEENKVQVIKRSEVNVPPLFEYNFVRVPDIAQSISVLCAGLGVKGLLSGLQTLRIKETDRIAALQTEHSKTGVSFYKMPAGFSKKTKVEYYMQEGRSSVTKDNIPQIDTYSDHRMAMAFAPISLLFPLSINDPMVVTKSYPRYWEDLKSLGFKMQMSD